MQRLLVVLVSVLIVANAHAVLRAPKPWNNAASKSNPCGGGTAPTAAAANWVVGQQVDITWQVQAGDGTGAVSVVINAAGGTTFTGQATQVGTANSVATSTFKFTVPNVQCTGANGLCSVQVKSSSNWFSCTSVKISSSATPAPAPTPVASSAQRAASSAAAAASSAQQAASSAKAASSAQQAASSAKAASSAQPAASSAQQAASSAQRSKEAIATSEVAQTQAPTPNNADTGIQTAICTVMAGLKFCAMANGRNVSFTSGENPDNVDASVRSTFGETLNNPLVFGTPKADGCEAALKNLLCGNALPLCGDKVACQPDCREAIAKCGLQDSHKDLFDCTQGNPTECLGSKVVAAPETAASDVSKVLVGASIVLALLM